MNNVLLHFPELKPTEAELQDPQLLVKLEQKRQMLIEQDLSMVQFEVKIADYGLSRVLQN